MGMKILKAARGNGKTIATRRAIAQAIEEGAIMQQYDKGVNNIAEQIKEALGVEKQVPEPKKTTRDAKDVELMKHYAMLKNYLKNKPPRNLRKKIRTEYARVKAELEKRGLL